MRRAVSSYNVSSFRSDNSSKISRRVESASALNMASLFELIFELYATFKLLSIKSNHKVAHKNIDLIQIYMFNVHKYILNCLNMVKRV